MDRLSTTRTIVLLLAAAFPISAQSIPGAVLARHEPHHHLAYEDSTLRVLRVQVPPHDTTLLHEHVTDYFWIALGASEVVNARRGGLDATVKSENLSIHYTVGNFAHVARNPGGTPFDNITVELLEPQTHLHELCEAPVVYISSPCSSLRIRGGVIERPAFDTDQLRVSLTSLQPGAVIQASAQMARVWVIALDTADVGRSLVIEGPGEWHGGVFRQSAPGIWRVKNQGASAVRVLTVVPLGPR